MLIDVVWVDLQPVNSTVVAICALWQSDFMGSAVWNVGFSALGRKNGVVKSKARHIQCIFSVFWCILMYSIQFWCIIFSCIQCVISVSRVSRDSALGFQICFTLSVWSCAVGAMYYNCRLSFFSFWWSLQLDRLFWRIPCEADVSAVRVNLSDSAQARPESNGWDINFLSGH